MGRLSLVRREFEVETSSLKGAAWALNAITRSRRRLAAIFVICMSLGFAAPVTYADESSIDADVRDAAHAVGDAGRQVGKDAKHAFQEVAPTARKVGHTVAHAAREAGKAVAQGARQTGTELKQAARRGVTAAKRAKKAKVGS